MESLKKTSTTRKLLFGSVIIFLISLVWFGFLLKERFFPEPKVHFHAGFLVVKDNKLVSFSDNTYQYFEPCMADSDEDEASKTPKEEQLEKAHLHDNIGDVVHVENNTSTWSDLFTNLKYPLDYSQSTAYLNGRQISHFESMRIKPYDSIVIFMGSTDEKEKFLAKAVKKDHIIDAEKKSEDCGS